jgi:superfamily II DNA/RNA helicase
VLRQSRAALFRTILLSRSKTTGNTFPLTTFQDLGLSQKVLNAVTDAGYDIPTPIQSGAIPFALQPRDILGIAQTGTGKTASFVLPMLTLLETGEIRQESQAQRRTADWRRVLR